MTSTTGTPRLSVAGYNLMLQWKSTPMWRAVRAVSDVVWVPGEFRPMANAHLTSVLMSSVSRRRRQQSRAKDQVVLL